MTKHQRGAIIAAAALVVLMVVGAVVRVASTRSHPTGPSDEVRQVCGSGQLVMDHGMTAPDQILLGYSFRLGMADPHSLPRDLYRDAFLMRQSTLDAVAGRDRSLIPPDWDALRADCIAAGWNPS